MGWQEPQHPRPRGNAGGGPVHAVPSYGEALNQIVNVGASSVSRVCQLTWPQEPEDLELKKTCLVLRPHLLSMSGITGEHNPKGINLARRKGVECMVDAGTFLAYSFLWIISAEIRQLKINFPHWTKCHLERPGNGMKYRNTKERDNGGTKGMRRILARGSGQTDSSSRGMVGYTDKQTHSLYL